MTAAFKKAIRGSSGDGDVQALRTRVQQLEQQLAAAKAKRVKIRGKSGDPNRGGWCTQKDIAAAIGRWDVDPFSNQRSHIEADAACMLERGDDGFGDGTPGSYSIAGTGLFRATAETRLFFQPDYSFVEKALDHYEHTRFCALLRFDPRTAWFRRLYRLSAMVCVLRSCNFEPPPGVTAPGSTFPHALFYRHPDDVTDAVLRKSIAWRKRPS